MKKLITTLIVALASLPSLAQYAGNAGITAAAPHFNTQGLVGWWKMNERTTGATVIDYSGIGNNGSPSNFPTYTSSVPKVNFPDPYALTFNGTSQYVSVARSSTLEPQNLTVAFWIKAGSSQVNYAAAVGKYYNDSYASWSFNYDTSVSNAKFYIYTTTTYYIAKINPFDGNWHHIAATANGSTLTVYKDGVMVGSPIPYTGTILYNSTATGVVEIGNYYNSSLDYLNGSIDDVRIYNRALSSNEVYRIAQGNG